MEKAYDSLKHSYVQLEVRSMELQSQLAMKKHMNRSTSNSSIVLSFRGGSGNGRRQSSATTAHMDIEMPAAVMSSSGGIVDRTFRVGSPPSSGGGSIGSEQSDLFRRALEAGTLVQDGLVMHMSDTENRSPEVGSAVSALGASSGNSSINGNKY